MQHNDSLEDSIYDHVLGAASPCESLVKHGVFPVGWVARYLEIVQELTQQYQASSALPRRAVWAVHFASWYLPLRYQVWCSTSGRSNEETVRSLSRLRSPSEIFIHRRDHEAGT